MKQDRLIHQDAIHYENADLIEHDVRILQEQLQDKYQDNCDLQDYIAKCCHELKLPLATSMLVVDKIKDVKIRGTMREQLERMSQEINAMLLGSKLQSELLDIQIKKTSLYILDQLFSNAIKYSREHPAIKLWATRKNTITKLYMEDNGEGISETDLRRIYEKEFTGNNHHNGKYKSTGMGLYMVSKIIKRLQHTIEVESKEGEFTRFCITFADNTYYCK